MKRLLHLFWTTVGMAGLAACSDGAATSGQSGQSGPPREGETVGGVASAVTAGDFPLNIISDGLDDNGLKLNPVWNIQRDDHNVLADVAMLCGGFDFANGNPLGNPLCTNYPVRTNFENPITSPIPALCDSPRSNGFHGHLNWETVTIEGTLQWDEFDNATLHDQDYNVLIAPDSKGLTTLEHPQIKIEFSAPETLEGFYDTPLWDNLWFSPSVLDGRRGIVTGLAGIDGVHIPEGPELHPAFAFSAEIDPTSSEGRPLPGECEYAAPGAVCRVDHWVTFVRSHGNEGFCSTGVEVLGLGGADNFKVRYPWKGPAGVPVTVVTNAKTNFRFPTAGSMSPGGIRNVTTVQDQSITVTYEYQTPGSAVAADLRFVYGAAGVFDLRRGISSAGNWADGGKFLGADFTGDGFADAAFAFNDGGNISIDVYVNNRNGTFTQQRWATRKGSWTDGGKFLSADFTGDGRPDIAFAFNDSGEISVDMYRNGGNGTFIQQRWASRHGAWTDGGKFLAGNFTADALPDIAFAFEDGGQISIDVHRNLDNCFLTGQCGFAVHERWASRHGAWTETGKFVAGDFTGDGHADIAFAFKDDRSHINIDVHRNAGAGFLLHQRWISEAGNWLDGGQFLAGDFNGDHRDDIAFVFRVEPRIDSSPKVSIDVYPQVTHTDGTMNFGENQRWSSSMGDWVDEVKFMAADFDNDGTVDLADAFNTNGHISIDYRRNLNVPPSPPVAQCRSIALPANDQCRSATITAADIDNGSFNPNHRPLTLSLNSTGPFLLGTSTVTLTVTDEVDHQTSTCTANVLVVDVDPPTVTPLADVVINACTSVPSGQLAPPLAGDNCGPLTFSNNAPAAFPVGTTDVVWSVSDGSGNVASTVQHFTVADLTPPIIAAPADITISTCVNAALGQPVASDNCGAVGVTNNAPAKFPIGLTVVTWTAQDAAGNVSTSQQRVTAILGDSASCCPAGTNIIMGTAANNVLVGTAAADCILGLGGNDTITGGNGDDFISGGPGNDTITGGNGNDVIFGGVGDDRLTGDAGNDTLVGDLGSDTLLGGDGDDRLFGNAGADILTGGNGNDVLDGGDDADILTGDSGNDILLGGAGNDTMVGGAGNDALDGGDGTDTCTAAPGADTILNCAP